MPSKREREYYRMGFLDGQRAVKGFDTGTAIARMEGRESMYEQLRTAPEAFPGIHKPKRKLSAWNKFVKANSKKKIYQFANGKLKLKKMGIAFRKTRAGRKR